MASTVKAAPTAVLPVKDGAAVQPAAFGPAKEAGKITKPARIQSAQSAGPLPVYVSASKQVVVKKKQAPAAPVKVDVAASPAAATSASSSPYHTGHAAREEHVSSSPAGASSPSAVRSPAARSSEASTTEPDSSAPTAPFKGPSTADAHFSQPSSTPIVPTTAPPVPSKASAVRTGPPVPINPSAQPSQTSAPGSAPSSAPSLPSPSSRLQSASSLAAPISSPAASLPSPSVPPTAAPAQPARLASTTTQCSPIDHKPTPSEARNGASATAVVNGQRHTAAGTASHAQQSPSESTELPPSSPDALPAPLHLADTSQMPQLTGKQADQDRGKTAGKAVRVIRCAAVGSRFLSYTLDAHFMLCKSPELN